jgi:hypothetical protein
VRIRHNRAIIRQRDEEGTPPWVIPHGAICRLLRTKDGVAGPRDWW